MSERILTTHVGSLPRPHDVLDAMQVRLAGGDGDSTAYDALLRRAVADIVARQRECGLDIVADGEVSKPGFFVYVRERLAGFEPRPGQGPKLFAAETAAFPEYYAAYFERAMLGGAVAPVQPLFCVGPVRYVGHDVLRRDLDNLRAALAEAPDAQAFVPSVAPSGVGQNDYYASEEEYLLAVADALREEYRAIVDAGFLLQIDDPFLSDVFADPALDDAGKTRRAGLYVEAVNHALRGIAPEKVRFHTCYGINEGPRVYEAALAEVVDWMLQVDAGCYSFEGANARHEHEYHLWERVKLPEGKTIMPGVITHASNIVEHPELIAERLVQYAERVGRENVQTGTDCGIGSRVGHEEVVWAKLSAMSEGARIASARLWK
jgi:5-methyltetrahydropteroyltriglutamate--homocysteine methyltransferase